eukprot:3160146-Lingulodinium_polyedra.AAC.1
MLGRAVLNIGRAIQSLVARVRRHGAGGVDVDDDDNDADGGDYGEGGARWQSGGLGECTFLPARRMPSS